jgi:hypothetical protein
MKKAISLLVGVLLMTVASAQVKVVHYNASWNSTHDVTWLDDLEDCKTKSVDIMDDQKAQKKNSIKVVPTIIVFNAGAEVARFEADISFTMKARKEEVQDIINELLISKF